MGASRVNYIMGKWRLFGSWERALVAVRLLKARLGPMEASRGYWELEGSKCELIDDV